MMGHILTLNAGSSSIKFGLYALPGGGESEPVVIARGLVEGIGTGPWVKTKDAAGQVLVDRALEPEADHAAGLQAALACLPHGDLNVVSVGHRIAHGGVEFPEPVTLDERTMRQLAGYTPFAPSHQPHNLKAVIAAQKAFPRAVQVACFDTAFHQGKDFVQDTYGLPRALYHEGIRRYGHHGLSYDYIAGALRKLVPEVASGRVVVCHLGNGASMCALDGGRSVESTMGFSALDGLPMGTRSGQLDPGILLYLMLVKHLDVAEVEELLYKQSGLKGISGFTNDMRDLEAAGTPEAEEAIGYFCAMIRREIGAMATTLGGLDAVVFTGGIGEHSARVRRQVIAPLGWLGVTLDGEANNGNGLTISGPDSAIKVMVVPTDEELVIARACLAFLPQLTYA